jgi:ribosomal protein S12 methylthiotransferase accessory factor YcaO
MRGGSTQAHPMTDQPVDLDARRGIAARKATDLRRTLAEVETKARDLRDRQACIENQLLLVSAVSWPEAAGKARYVMNLYAAGLSPGDTRHRALVAAILEDFVRLTRDS